MQPCVEDGPLDSSYLLFLCSTVTFLRHLYMLRCRCTPVVWQIFTNRGRTFKASDAMCKHCRTLLCCSSIHQKHQWLTMRQLLPQSLRLQVVF